MLQRFVKKFFVTIFIAVITVSSSYPEAFIGDIISLISLHNKKNIVDKIYLAKQNKNVVDNFGMKVEKAVAAVNPAEREYMVDLGPVSGSTAANYVYGSLFNPSGSGRTIVVKRVGIRTNTASSTASNYVNLSLRRTTAASAGTQVTTVDIPKKNTNSSDSIADVRHTGVTVTFAGVTDSRILGLPQSGAVGALHARRSIDFGTSDEKLILQPGEGVAVYQEAAGTLTASVRAFFEWEEQVTAPTAENEFLFAFPRVEVAATANYAYNTFFNPAGSGKTAVVKRIWFGSETCDAAAVYTNNIVLRRISAASAGTQIVSTNIPKKHTGSANSVMEFRRTGVTVTTVGGADARLGNVTPCAAAGQSQGWQEINFHEQDEKLILRNGEGVALMSDTAGDIDQLVRMIVEWDEVTSAPTATNEYIWASSRVEAAAALNTTHYTLFNPVGSGKTAKVKRIVLRVNADAAAVYGSFTARRISAASAGTQVASTDLPEKNTSSVTSSMEVRWCGAACGTAITATYQGDADSRLLSVTAPAAVAQMSGQREIVLSPHEAIILQPGEGVGIYNELLASDIDQYVKVQFEWEEVASAPSALDEYLLDIGPINGSTATSYTYATLFNPSGSGKSVVVKRIGVRVNTVAAAGYIPMQLRRITAASAGTQIASTSVPKKHSGAANTVAQIRRTGVTTTYAGTADSKIFSIQTPGAIESLASRSTGYREVLFNPQEQIILQPGEGVGFYHDTAAGDADLRVRLLVEWEEVVIGSTPSPLSEYMMTTGPITQSTSANYVYSTFFNPTGSSKNYLVKRIGMQVNRSGTAVTPAYTPVTIRRITAASNGTLIASSSVARKHQGSATTTAEIRTTGVTATLSGATNSRLLGITTPGVVNQLFGQYETEITEGDEFVLQEGEGLALFQEQATGDALVRYRFMFEWKEESNAAPPQSLTFSVSTSTIYFGVVSSVQARYASSTNQSGSNTEVEAHTFSVATNATNGYTVTAKGQTLTSGIHTINAIGNTNTASATGTEQFGIRLTSTGGSGVVTSPYAASGFAYAGTATTSTQVASASIGDDAETVYSVRYIANIAPVTEPATYSANLVYVATANF